MSLRSTMASLNSPALVAAAGCATLVGLPFLEAAVTTLPLAALKGLNATALLVNIAAVSTPGRIDEQQDAEMRQGKLNPTKPGGEKKSSAYSAARKRTLVAPSGWAFAIWGPIYLGESIFVAAQFFGASSSDWATILPQMTAPFVAANVCQSLWCASFRPSYESSWKRHVSTAALAGTAYSLSKVHAITCSEAVASSSNAWYLLPLTLHFGWTTAATFVNFNGSLAAIESTPARTLAGVGHASAVAATAVGVGLTLVSASPAYGLTLAWALAACAEGAVKKGGDSAAAAKSDGVGGRDDADVLRRAASVQRYLCWIGSAACAAASAAAAAGVAM